jgi:hypothetical protein
MALEFEYDQKGYRVPVAHLFERLGLTVREGDTIQISPCRRAEVAPADAPNGSWYDQVIVITVRTPSGPSNGTGKTFPELEAEWLREHPLVQSGPSDV